MENPFQTPPYEKLQRDLSGAYSRRINIKLRFAYEVLEDEKTVKILSMWTHYEFWKDLRNIIPKVFWLDHYASLIFFLNIRL